MDTYYGKIHLPGVKEEWIVSLDIDVEQKLAIVNFEGQAGHISTWQGLEFNIYGDYEIVFKTKGIPPLITHWWHFVKPDINNLWGIVVGLPDKTGQWTTCQVELKRAGK